jgi:hypothetical protein
MGAVRSSHVFIGLYRGFIVSPEAMGGKFSVDSFCDAAQLIRADLALIFLSGMFDGYDKAKAMPGCCLSRNIVIKGT